jgi:hypothetical protein
MIITADYTNYTAWLKAKVKASLEDPRPSIPHDEVMTEMRELIELKFKAIHLERTNTP